MDEEEEIQTALTDPPAKAAAEALGMQEQFAQQASPFKLDLAPYTSDLSSISVDEVRLDPAIDMHVGNIWTVTDEIRPQIFTPELEALENGIIAASEAQLPQDQLALQTKIYEYNAMFAANFEQASPKLFDVAMREADNIARGRLNIDFMVDASELSPEQQLELQRGTEYALQEKWNSTLRSGYFFTEITDTETGQFTLENGEVVEGITHTIFPATMLPGKEFRIEDAAGIGPAAEQATKPPPGTLNEWVALVTAHETEHRADDGQQTATNYMIQRLNEQIDSDSTIVYAPMIEKAADMSPATRHIKEIEADMAAYQSLDGVISQDVKDYWTALRMGDGLLQNTKVLLRLRADKGADFTLDDDDVGKIHDTGFFLAEFEETGELPDYESMQADINSFYNKTVDHMISRAAPELQSYPTASYMDMQSLRDNLQLSDMVDTVQDALKADPPVYSPAEQIFAQKFIDSMTEDLGIQPGDMNAAIVNAVETSGSVYFNPSQDLNEMSPPANDSIPSIKN